MNRTLRFLYDTWYGMLAAWCATGLLSLVVGFGLRDSTTLAWLVNSIVASHILVVTPLALLAPIVFVCRRKWKYLALNVEVGQTSCQLFRIHLFFGGIVGEKNLSNLIEFVIIGAVWGLCFAIRTVLIIRNCLRTRNVGSWISFAVMVATSALLIFCFPRLPE